MSPLASPCRHSVRLIRFIYLYSRGWNQELVGVLGVEKIFWVRGQLFFYGGRSIFGGGHWCFCTQAEGIRLEMLSDLSGNFLCFEDRLKKLCTYKA